jgi:uncharacterized protein
MKLGNIASGKDFFDRNSECEDLWRYLKNEHVVASGPRRLGKSSIVNRLREQAIERGLLAEHVDVQGVTSAQEFIDEIAKHFPEKSISGYLATMGSKAKEWLSAIKKIELSGPGGLGGGIELEVSGRQTWANAATTLQQRLSAVPVLIFVDEFSVFIEKLLRNDRDGAEALLAWLRKWRVTPNIACRFLFTGSIGLHALLEHYGLSAQINDCFEYPIGPFKAQAAKDMVVYFAHDEGWAIEPDHAAALCARIGWLSPYLICVLLDQSIQAARDRLDEMAIVEQLPEHKWLTTGDIDSGYERAVAARSRFVHWEERLERDLSPMALRFAHLILSALAKNKTGLTHRQLHARSARLDSDPDQRAHQLQSVLQKLRDEGYISPSDAQGKMTFLSIMLRDYWARNHV